MSFIKRVLEARFTLAYGGFAGTTNDTLKLNTLDLKNLRISSKMVNAGGAAMGELQLGIYGMTASQMKTLSTLGMRIQQVPIHNTVTLLAGDADSGLSVVFEGGIQSAFADLEAMPNALMRVVAKSGIPQAVTAAPSTSYRGAINVSQVLAGMAVGAGMAFENSGGVDVVIPNQYYHGTVRNQIKRCCNNAGIGWTIENNTLIIWPQNGARGTPIPLVTPDTGLIGYPAYTATGIRFKSIFNPAIKFRGKIKVISDQVPESIWTVYKLGHDLDADVVHGKWESDMECQNPDFPTPIPR